MKKPPTLPYWIPILGHTFSVLFDNMKLSFYIALASSLKARLIIVAMLTKKIGNTILTFQFG